MVKLVKNAKTILVKMLKYLQISYTGMFLFRTFQRPFIPQALPQENIDHLLLAITVKLKSKSRGVTALNFHHDCFLYLFFNKGRPSKDGKSTMLEKNDFALCNFHDLWNQCLDKNGDGVRIKFPLKVHLTLSWSPEISDPTKDAH